MAALVFRLTIATDNDAFDGDARNHETARILRDIAHRLDCGESFEMFQTLLDCNGNDVGRAAFKPNEPREIPARRRRGSRS